jgi:exosortase/archaeosortase family protein
MMVIPAPLRFGLKFVTGFALLTLGFEGSRGTTFEQVVVEQLMLKPTTTLLQTLTPRDGVELRERTIASAAGHNLRVVRGCEGVELFIMLIAAIFAFPTTIRLRLRGLLFGGLLAYELSVFRLAALHYTLEYYPGMWEGAHGLLLPLAPIVVLSLYFLRWTSATSVEQTRDFSMYAR